MDTLLDFCAGCVGGATGLLVGHPFDTVKVRLQLQTNSSFYRGTFHCFKAIVQREGVLGLYKGITSPLYSVAFINAIIFSVQGDVQRRMASPTALSTYAVSGAAAGFVQCFICSPMELAKIRMQMQGTGQARLGQQANVTYRSSFDCLTKIYGSEGWRGVYKGMWFTILREVPSFTIYFTSYEYLCRLFSRRSPNEPVPTWALLASGGTAGCLSWLFLNPVDVIKSRIQMDGVLRTDGKVAYEYKGYADCFFKSVAREGYGVLTKGLSSTLLRAFPTNAATLTTVTWLLRVFNPKEMERDKIATLERSSVMGQLE